MATLGTEAHDLASNRTGGPGGKLTIGVLISGRGSNLQALIDAAARPEYPARIGLVISNVAGAHGLERAARAGLPTQFVAHTAFATRGDFESSLTAALRQHGCELVCLAGFMRLLSGPFVETWWDRLINIHPSLLPAFRGLRVHERVIEYGARITGCTVHYVRPEMDDGPIIAQAAVPVLDDDDADRLGARVLVEEHRIYPLAVALIGEGRARVENNRVRIEGGLPASGALLSPAG